MTQPVLEYPFALCVVYISGFYFNHQDTSYVIFICTSGRAPYSHLEEQQIHIIYGDNTEYTLTARVVLSLFLF